MSIIIGIDHGYYAIKTAHCSFPAGLTSYGEHEPYTRQGLLEFGGCFFVCGSGRQPIQRDKTVNDNYYLLTLAAIAKEIQQRGLPHECSVRLAAGLPLTSFGRDKPKFRDYLLRSKQPVNFRFEGVEYSIYFALQPYVGTEEIGWMCILGAAPFAACGFFTYHGMTAEQVLWAWFKSEILCPKRLVFKSDSYYYEAMQPAIRAGIKRKRGKPMKKNTHDSEETA